MENNQDLYCQFCEENVLFLLWKKHLKSNQHIQAVSLCINARTSNGLFCKECCFLADKTWCRLENPGEEDLVLGKEFLGYAKEPMRSSKCNLAILGRSSRPIRFQVMPDARYSITVGEMINNGRSKWQSE